MARLLALGILACLALPGCLGACKAGYRADYWYRDGTDAPLFGRAPLPVPGYAVERPQYNGSLVALPSLDARFGPHGYLLKDVQLEEFIVRDDGVRSAIGAEFPGDADPSRITERFLEMAPRLVDAPRAVLKNLTAPLLASKSQVGYASVGGVALPANQVYYYHVAVEGASRIRAIGVATAGMPETEVAASPRDTFYGSRGFYEVDRGGYQFHFILAVLSIQKTGADRPTFDLSVDPLGRTLVRMEFNQTVTADEANEAYRRELDRLGLGPPAFGFVPPGCP